MGGFSCDLGSSAQRSPLCMCVDFFHDKLVYHNVTRYKMRNLHLRVYVLNRVNNYSSDSKGRNVLHFSKNEGLSVIKSKEDNGFKWLLFSCSMNRVLHHKQQVTKSEA